MQLTKVERGHYYGKHNDYWKDTSYYLKEYSGKEEYHNLKDFFENNFSYIKDVYNQEKLNHENNIASEYEDYKKREGNNLLKQEQYIKKSKLYKFFNIAPIINPFETTTINKEFEEITYLKEQMIDLSNTLNQYQFSPHFFVYRDINDTFNNKPYLIDSVLNIVQKLKNNKPSKLKM